MEKDTFETQPADVTNTDDVAHERARVVAVQPQVPGKTGMLVWVEAFHRSTCGDCAASDTCGQGVLGRWFQRKARCYPVTCDTSVAPLLTVGQWVDIAVPNGTLVKASLLVFIAPLIMMIIAAVIADALFTADSLVLLGGVLGFISGFLIIRRIEQFDFFGQFEQPRIVGVSQ